MTEENKIYYETILEERKHELEDIINKYDVRVVTLRQKGLRPKIYSEQSANENKNILDVWKTREKLYINGHSNYEFEEMFTLMFLESDKGYYESEEVYYLFCKYFKKLVENKHGRMYRDDLIRKGKV